MLKTKLFERRRMPAMPATKERLSSLRPLEKELQILWLGAMLDVDVPIEAITKDLVWGSSLHPQLLLYIPCEWFIDAALQRSLSKQAELQWIIVEASSCLLTMPPPPYQESPLPHDWWLPFLAWNGSPMAESWLKAVKSRIISRVQSLSPEEVMKSTLSISLEEHVTPHPQRIISQYEKRLILMALFPGDIKYRRAFYRFLEDVSKLNPLLGHLLVKAHGFTDFIGDKHGISVLDAISAKRYREYRDADMYMR